MLNFKLIAPYKVNKVLSATMEECLEFINNTDEIAVDIETTRKFKGKYGRAEGLDPYLSSIVMLQLGNTQVQYVIDARYIDCHEIVKALSTKLLIGHNIKFEYKHFLINYDVRLLSVYDTMVAEQIIYNGLNKKNSLANLNSRYLGITVDKTTRLEFLSIGNAPFTFRQIKYGAEDVAFPFRIKDLQAVKIKTKGLQRCCNLEMDFLLGLGDIEAKGLHFNQSTWLDIYHKAVEKRTDILKTLVDYTVANFPDFVEMQLSLFSTEIKCTIKWTSSKQVIKLFDSLGICPEEVSKSTKKLSKTVSSTALKGVLTRDDLSDDHRWLIKTYLEFKRATQATTTFGEAYFKYVNPITKRLHSGFTQIMKTGRVSSSNPNLQNIPSDAAYRKAFDCPDGYNIVNADYSGQEQIILANESLDADLLHFYNQGFADMHSFVASKIYPHLSNIPLEDIKGKFPEERQISKAAGFAINYGGNGFTISKNLGLPKSIGEEVFNAYFKAFPGLNDYFDRCKEKALRLGYIEIDAYTGRKYYFPQFIEMQKALESGDSRHYELLKGKLERASLNYPIQGTAGSMTKLAVVYIRMYLLEHNAYDRFQITNVVHDEINCEAKSEYAEECAKVMEYAMKKASKIWCKVVPMNAVAKIGSHWAH